ncbi:unnamed protein product [Cunninghamella blakesleeana]
MPAYDRYPYEMQNTAPYYESPTSISQSFIPPPPPPLPLIQPPPLPSQQYQNTSFLSSVSTHQQQHLSSLLHDRSSNARYGPHISRLNQSLTFNSSDLPQPSSSSSSSASTNPSSYNMSISSAISTTTGTIRLQQDHCFDSIDLRTLFGDDLIGTLQQKERIDYLDFRLATHSSINSYGIKNYIPYHDGTVFSILDSHKTTNVILKYNGHKNCCSVSQIILRSPQTGQIVPNREGMIFISHQPINIEDTQPFSHFTKNDFDHYQKVNRKSDFLAAWFQINDDQPTIVDLSERTGKYILIKYFPIETIIDNIDLQYIAFLGYVGARSFSKGDLC